MKGAVVQVLDFVLLVMVLLFAVINLPSLEKEWSTPIVAEIEDKTALKSDNSIYVNTEDLHGYDLLMSLVAVDENTPFPRSVRINSSPIIDLNNVWVTDQYNNIIDIFDVSGDYKLGAMVDYKIENITYVNNGNDPYWQYDLVEEVP